MLLILIGGVSDRSSEKNPVRGQSHILIVGDSSTGKSQLLLPMLHTPSAVPVAKTTSHAMTSTTAVRTAVARFELTPSMPTFASIEVKAAKNAEHNA